MRQTGHFSRRAARLPLLDVCAIFFLTAILIWPLFRIEYLNNWASIDSTFIAAARFLTERWPQTLWFPFWYCGTRFDYIYPPALPYGAALVSLALHVSPARAYHLYTAFFYCCGAAAMYAMARIGGASRIFGWLAAAGTAVFSPSFLFLKAFRDDAPLHIPQRLNVLVRWGEGPHVTALSLLPVALFFSWRAIQARRPASLALAAVFCGLVVSTNLYGATSLAVLFTLLVWSLWITHRERAIVWRAAGIVALAYGLTAFWLTPSFLRVTIENLKLVAQPGDARSRWLALAVAALFAAGSAKLAQGRRVTTESQAYRIFLCGAALSFTFAVAGKYYFGLRVAGEPHRFVPELDAVLILLGVEGLRALASASAPSRRIAAAVIAVITLAAAYPYLAHPWSVFAADPNYRDRVEYRLSDWIAHNLPGARVFATGSVRLWYNVWRNGEQVGGGSDQGMLNSTLALTQWQVIHDSVTGRDIDWLQATGADAIIVPQPESGILAHEIANPRKFAGRLFVIYDDGQGNIIYRVPRRFPGHARVVETGRMARLRPIPFSNDNSEQLADYAAAVENGPNSQVDMQWEGAESMRLRARIREGESLLVQQSYDPAWRAYYGERQVPIQKDVAGFMRIDVAPGTQEIRLVFELPFENTIGRVLTAIALGIVAALFYFGLRSTGG